MSTQQVHSGKIVSVEGQTLTMSDDDGSNVHSHEVPTDCKVTLDCEESTLDDLQPGDEVTVYGAPDITAIEAMRE